MAKAKKKLTVKKAKSPTKSKPAAKAKAKTQPKAKTAKKAKTQPKVKTVKKVKTAKKVKAAKKAQPVKKAGPASKAKPAAPKAAKSKENSKKVPSQRVNLSDYLTPLDDRVLVQIEAGERMTAGGLFIPDTATVTGNRKGWIVSVGPGHRDKKGHFRPLDVKVGDRVLFGEWAGTELLLGDVAPGAEFKILRETDLLGVVED